MSKKQVEKEIKAVLEDMAASFAEKDNKKYLDIFAKDFEVVIYGSQEGEKWTSVDKYMKSVDQNWEYAEKIEVVYDWLKINSKDDVAWIATDVTFKTKVNNLTMSIQGRMTAVFLKENSNWKIVQSHFSMENKKQQ